MSFQSAELKIRDLASANTTLQADLGTAPFRWFDRQIAQGQANNGPCVSVQRISTVRAYNQGGLMPLSAIRLQINIVSYSAETARQVAADVAAFMATFDLTNPGAYASPVYASNHTPNFLVNERAGMFYQLQPPAYVETQDWRIYNVENLPN